MVIPSDAFEHYIIVEIFAIKARSLEAVPLQVPPFPLLNFCTSPVEMIDVAQVFGSVMNDIKILLDAIPNSSFGI